MNSRSNLHTSSTDFVNGNIIFRHASSARYNAYVDVGESYKILWVIKAAYVQGYELEVQ